MLLGVSDPRNTQAPVYQQVPPGEEPQSSQRRAKPRCFHLAGPQSVQGWNCHHAPPVTWVVELWSWASRCGPLQFQTCVKPRQRSQLPMDHRQFAMDPRCPNLPNCHANPKHSTSFPRLEAQLLSSDQFDMAALECWRIAQQE